MKTEEIRELKGPLDGIRVVECAHWVQGPTAGQILGDLGADIIKVEDRLRGDFSRGIQETRQGGVNYERNFFFECCNRNKRSITVDLRNERGRQIIYHMVKSSDVFLTNFRLGVPEKLGIGYKTISHHNPKIIYGHGSSWGSSGPISEQPAFEALAEARSGMMYIPGEAGMPPLHYAISVGDNLGAWVLVQGILAALLARERLGIGQEVSCSLFGSMISWQNLEILCKLITGDEFPRRFRATVGNPLQNYYQCNDGKWIYFTMPQADRYWHNFCKAIGHEEFENDPKFVNMPVRAQNAEELISMLDKIFITKSRDEWLEVLLGQDVVCGPVQTHSELVNDPQALLNNYITDFNHPVWGQIKVIGLPYVFSETPGSLRRSSPEFGEHTEEILLEFGYSWDDIASLKEDEAI